MNVNVYFFAPLFVEVVYSKEKSLVEHLLPWHLQSKQYKAMVKDCHATESTRIGTNIRMICLRNFTVIFNNGLYSSCNFKDVYVQIIFSRVKLTSVKITENLLLILYSDQRKTLSKISLGCLCIIATYHYLK
jgi:hypothetical protein